MHMKCKVTSQHMPVLIAQRRQRLGRGYTGHITIIKKKTSNENKNGIRPHHNRSYHCNNSGVIGEGREAAERGHVYDTEADANANRCMAGQRGLWTCHRTCRTCFANRFGWGDLTTTTPTTTTATPTTTPTYVRAPFSRRGAFFSYFWRDTMLWPFTAAVRSHPPSASFLMGLQASGVHTTTLLRVFAFPVRATTTTSRS